ncbi:MAG: sigma-70 family RNA polymerase sigma factor [Candidatus Zixiibacteriota bacterium]
MKALLFSVATGSKCVSALGVFALMYRQERRAGSESLIEKDKVTSRPGALDPAEWVDKHGDYLYRFARVRLRDDGLAEDCVQETFLAALKARASFAGNSSERTWLTGILKHKITDAFRAQGREKLVNLDLEVLLPVESADLFQRHGEWPGHFKAVEGPADWSMSPEEAYERNEFWLALKKCLDLLPPKMAKAFILRELDQVPASEIVETLNISQSNFWVLMHRARAQLRYCLERSWAAAR